MGCCDDGTQTRKEKKKQKETEKKKKKREANNKDEASPGEERGEGRGGGGGAVLFAECRRSHQESAFNCFVAVCFCDGGRRQTRLMGRKTLAKECRGVGVPSFAKVEGLVATVYKGWVGGERGRETLKSNRHTKHLWLEREGRGAANINTHAHTHTYTHTSRYFFCLLVEGGGGLTLLLSFFTLHRCAFLLCAPHTPLLVCTRKTNDEVPRCELFPVPLFGCRCLSSPANKPTKHLTHPSPPPSSLHSPN